MGIFTFILKQNVNVIFTHQKYVAETSKQAYSDFVVDVDELISVFDEFKVLSFYQFLITLPFIIVCKVDKMSLIYGDIDSNLLFFFTLPKTVFTVCPVPMNKEEEEMIKEQERKKEEMEEIMREIEITCLGELIK